MKKLFVVFLLLVAMNLNAQWVSVGPWGGDVYGIGSNNSGLYALTPNTIYKSTDYGNTWSGILITVDGVNNAINRVPYQSNDNFILNNNVNFAKLADLINSLLIRENYSVKSAKSK